MQRWVNFCIFEIFIKSKITKPSVRYFKVARNPTKQKKLFYYYFSMRLIYCIVGLLCISLSCLLINRLTDSFFNNLSNDITYNRRRSLLSTFLPATDKYFEFGGKRVVNTTTKDLPKLFKELLYKRLGNDSSEKKDKGPLALEELNSALKSLEKDLQWDPVSQTFKNDAALVDAYHGMNYFDHILKVHDKRNHAEKKRLEESLTSQFEKNHDERSIDSMFDVVVVTGNSSVDVLFLEKWRSWIHNMHVIIIQQGDPERLITIPAWVEYELYNKNDVNKAVGSNNMWIFDMDGDGQQAANFGFLVADREFVYLVDRFSIPREASSSMQQEVGAHYKYNMLHMHARQLLKPSLVFYFQNPNNNPYSRSSDFLRGYPYSLREGIQTAITLGEVIPAPHTSEQDFLTKLFKDQHMHSPETYVAGAGGENHTMNELPTDKELSVSVPLKNLFSLTITNIAFNRKILGPALCLIQAAGSKMDFPVHRNYEIFTGWILKTLGDHVGFGVKHIVNPTFMYREVPTSSPASFMEELRGDLLWIQYHEDIVRFFSSLELSERTRNDMGDAMRELVQKMKAAAVSVHPVLGHAADIMGTYQDLWNKRHHFDMKILPVASRSKMGPKPGSVHSCAAFTIAHNETFMLNVWLRYYGRHLPDALWVLNHLSGDDKEANEVKVDKSGHSTATIVNLYGDRAGFPMGFFTSQADLMQRRLFRLGYKCVLLSDVDEMVVPDPAVYPDGLKQYLKAFENSTNPFWRVNGFIIAHVSTPDGNENAKLEPPIDWSKSILQQRHYMASQPKYCKPLLSKVPLRYKAGFHTVFIPSYIPMDEHLRLFHLRDVDKDFCLSREHQKFKLIQRGHQSEIDKVLNTHIVQHETLLKKGEVCQYAISTFYKKYNGAFENTGKYRLLEIDSKFHSVEV